MSDSLSRHRITIYLDGHGTHWWARAYDDDTDEHVWSSEDASSATQALREVGEGIEQRVAERAAA